MITGTIIATISALIISFILWGEILLNSEGKHDLENRKIVLGGCCVSENDPDKECNDCGTRYKT